jgi:hypothetical protein
VRVTNIMYNKILVIEYCLCFFAIIGCGLGLILYLLRENVEANNDETYEQIILGYIMLSTVVLVIGQYFRY